MSGRRGNGFGYLSLAPPPRLAEMLDSAIHELRNCTSLANQSTFDDLLPIRQGDARRYGWEKKLAVAARNDDPQPNSEGSGKTLERSVNDGAEPRRYVGYASNDATRLWRLAEPVPCLKIDEIRQEVKDFRQGFRARRALSCSWK